MSKEYKPICKRCGKFVEDIDATLKYNWHYDGHGIWFCENCYEWLAEFGGAQ